MPRPRTVIADLQWLRGALAWASKRRMIPENPLRGFQLPRDPNPRRAVASHDRYERLVAAIEPLIGTKDESGREVIWPTELRLILALVNGTGRRLSAVLHLKVSDLLLDEKPYGAIRWRAEWDKGKRDQVVPINREVRAEIDRFLYARPAIGDAWLVPSRRKRKANRPLSRSGAANMLKRAEKLAKLPHLSGSTWHAYRRKWATERKHLPAVDVAAAGGWKNVRTLQTVYQQPDQSSMLRVVSEPVELRENRA